MASTTSSIVNTLGAGSGIDIKTLAESLVEAERSPRKQAIDTKVAKTEAKISGYGALKYALSDLKAAFATLDDASELNSITVSNSQPGAFGVTTTARARAEDFSLQVNRVAQGQRSVGTFDSRGQELNGSAFWLNVTIGGAAPSAVKVTTPTPAGMVSAINGAKLGVTAQLLETGELNGDGSSRVIVVLTGPEGAGNSFSVAAVTSGADDVPTTTPLNGLGADRWLKQQDAGNASLTINGQTITRPSNVVSDVLEGVTLQLYAQTSGAARLELNRDTSGIKEKLTGLVKAYNDFQDSLRVLGDSKSDVEKFGGSLSGDSLLRSVRDQIRATLSNPSSAPGERLTSAWQVGLSIDRDGKLTLDEAKLDAALQDNFGDVVTVLTAGTSGKSLYGSERAGIAGDAVRQIDKMLRSNGVIDAQVGISARRLDDYKKDLAKLEERMTSLLERYTKQFAAMDSLVSQSKSVQSSLKNSLSALMKSSE